MLLIGIKEAIRLRTGEIPLTQFTEAGIAVGVESSVKGIYHWSLVPISDDSGPKFVDFMDHCIKLSLSPMVGRLRI